CLIRRITVGPNQPREYPPLTLDPRGERQGPQWKTEVESETYDCRTGRGVIIERWEPIDAAANEEIARRQERRRIESLESRLLETLGAYCVPASELEAELEKTVWLVDGGTLGKTYVQDL